VKERKLADLINTQSGFAFRSKEYTENGHFLVRIGNVQDGYLSLRNPRYVALDEKTERFALDEGDFLTSLTGNIGRVARVEKAHLPAALNQRVAKLKVRDESALSSDYLFFYLSSEFFRENLSKDGHGAAQQNVSPSAINELTIPVPPLPEQQRIVGILDEAFAGIATAKANAEKNLQNARALFESHLNAVFSQRGEGWVETVLEDEIDLLSGFAFKSAQYTDDEKGIRLLRGDNIIQGCLRWDNAKRWPANDTQKYERYWLREGDVVLAMDRPWVKAGLKHAIIAAEDLPCLLVQRTARLRVGASLSHRFLKLLIGNSAFTSHILGVQTGIGVPHISGRQIRDFEFVRPPLAVQLRIADNLESLRAETSRLEALYEQKLAALEALKNSLLHQAFAGEL
jgi:type I restriction enzyme, S subunit